MSHEGSRVQSGQQQQRAREVPPESFYRLPKHRPKTVQIIVLLDREPRGEENVTLQCNYLNQVGGIVSQFHFPLLSNDQTLDNSLLSYSSQKTILVVCFLSRAPLELRRFDLQRNTLKFHEITSHSLHISSSPTISRQVLQKSLNVHIALANPF